MKRELFDEIFDREIEPFVEEMLEYEPFIEKRNLAPCKRDIYNEYSKLRVIYKRQVYNSDVEILDRHKVASCMCGAFLTVPIFHKGHLLEAVKQHGEPVESFFYYANEFIAFYATNKFLSFYMLCETDNLRGMDEADRSLRKERILRQYPLMPPASKVKETRGTWSGILFNLSRIREEERLGIEHYDLYAYATIFFMLEAYFNQKTAFDQKKDEGKT